MDKKLWGSSLWRSMHCIALTYPENPSFDDKRHYRAFFESLQYVLPCELCRSHYQKNLKILTIDLSSREALFKWSIQMHNLVNELLGKEVWTVEKAYSFYTSNCNINSSHRLFLWLTVIGIIIVALIINIIYWRNKKS